MSWFPLRSTTAANHTEDATSISKGSGRLEQSNLSHIDVAQRFSYIEEAISKSDTHELIHKSLFSNSGSSKAFDFRWRNAHVIMKSTCNRRFDTIIHLFTQSWLRGKWLLELEIYSTISHDWLFPETYKRFVASVFHRYPVPAPVVRAKTGMLAAPTADKFQEAVIGKWSIIISI